MSYLVPGFYSGTLAVIAAWVALTFGLSGCRFGNRTELGNTDPYSGNYDTAPATLHFQVKTTAGTQTVETSATLVPDELAHYFTDPVALRVDKEGTLGEMGNAYFGDPTEVNATQPKGLPVSISTKGEIATGLQYEPEPLWFFPDCLVTTQLVMQGQFARYAQPMPAVEGKTASIGSMQLTAAVIDKLSETYVGACAADLAEMESCYRDTNQCRDNAETSKAQSHAYVKAVFKKYIDAGALTVDDISSVTSLAYYVTYK